MTITKYLHSCLLVKEKDKTILLDPGIFTYEAKVFPIQTITELDYILITHEHPDHCAIPFIKELVSRFPDVTIISTESVVSLLEKEQIAATTQGNEWIEITALPHEDVVTALPPENIQFTLFQSFTDPGDSHHMTRTAPILALPFQAPWGSFADALKLAESLSPKFIIPVHDWHWKDEVRKQLYQRAAAYLEQSDIIVKGLETGESVDITL